MLTVVVCAMLAGARTYAAIGEWSADLNAARRAALGFTGRAPGPVTIWRLLVRIDAAALDEVVNVWTRAHLERVNEAARAPDRRPMRQVLAVDGKAMRATLRGMFRVRMSSSDGDQVGAPGSCADWGAMGPNVEQSRTPGHAGAGRGSRNRSAPKGGLAYGTPSTAMTSGAVRCPRTDPPSVLNTVTVGGRDTARSSPRVRAATDCDLWARPAQASRGP